MKFRKKPIVIEALQLKEDYDNILGCIHFAIEDLTHSKIADRQNLASTASEQGGIFIPTLEGDMKASFGDYIIKGVNGEFYPCKPDIFEKSYDKAEEQ